MHPAVESWQLRGSTHTVLTRKIFTLDLGSRDARPVLFLHGFPTCSHDWKKIIPLLETNHRLILPDFLGYGLSEKPAHHRYSLFEQADLVTALVHKLGIGRLDLVSHDMGNSVALELLRRKKVRPFSIRRYVMLNGSIWLKHARLLPIQRLLMLPIIGDTFARLFNQPAFGSQFSKVFAPENKPTQEEINDHWAFIHHADGQRNYSHLTRYLKERQKHEERWMNALKQSTDVPLTLIWGMLDPVAVPKVGKVVLTNRPDAKWIPLKEAGHYPQMECPDEVADLIGKAFA